MTLIIRLIILFVAFIFGTFLYVIFKEVAPQSFLTGGIFGAVFFLFLYFVWIKTKNIGNKANNVREEMK